jgi:prephenate dehydratase
LKIGIQGGIGSTNEKAAHEFAKSQGWKDYKLIYLINTEPVLESLSKDEIDFGVFAYRSTAALVAETQKALEKYSVKKIAELTLQLDHALLATEKIAEKELVRIYSHPQALKEHQSFLEQRFKNIALIEEIDTALAAEKLIKGEYPDNSLAIAPLDCARIFNLEVFENDLPRNREYFTTFWLVRGPKTEGRKP